MSRSRRTMKRRGGAGTATNFTNIQPNIVYMECMGYVGKKYMEAYSSTDTCGPEYTPTGNYFVKYTDKTDGRTYTKDFKSYDAAKAVIMGGRRKRKTSAGRSRRRNKNKKRTLKYW